MLGKYSGVGTESRQRAFTLPDAPGSLVLFEMTYSGTDEFNFFVVDTNHGASYERRLTPDCLFGPYEGVRAIAYKDGRFEDQQETADRFNIHVEGTAAWEVRVGLPDFEAPPVTSAKGLGDQVIGPFVLRSGDPFVTDFVFEVTHQGRDFTARLIASDGTARALVPQQNAPFKNKVYAPWNPDKGTDDLSYDDYVLDIHADDEWTVRFLNPAPETVPPTEGIALRRVLGVYTGVGSEEIVHTLAYASVPNSPILFDIDFRGGNAFEVVLEDSFSQYQRRLTPDATIGPYHGVRALPYRDGELDGQSFPPFNILVEALGAWEVKIGLPDFASPPITVAKGKGHQVIGPFVLRSMNPSHDDFLFEVTHAGASFEARLIASDGAAGYLIPPQYIPFKDRKRPLSLRGPGAPGTGPDDLAYGEYVLAIQADGDWEVKLMVGESEVTA